MRIIFNLVFLSILFFPALSSASGLGTPVIPTGRDMIIGEDFEYLLPPLIEAYPVAAAAAVEEATDAEGAAEGARDINVDLEYWYQDLDMYILLAERAHEVGLGYGFVVMAALGPDVRQLVVHLRERKQFSQRVLLVPYNIHNLHWVGLVLYFNVGNQVEGVIYIDPRAQEMPQEIKDALVRVYGDEVIKKIEEKKGLLQPDDDGCACGPLTIENLILIAQGQLEARKANQELIKQIRVQHVNLLRSTRPEDEIGGLLKPTHIRSLEVGPSDTQRPDKRPRIEANSQSATGMLLAQALTLKPDFNAMEQARLIINMLTRGLTLIDDDLKLAQEIIGNIRVDATMRMKLAAIMIEGKAYLGQDGLRVAQMLIKNPKINATMRARLVTVILARGLDLGQDGLAFAQALAKNRKVSPTGRASLAATMFLLELELGDGGLVRAQGLITNPKIRPTGRASLVANMLVMGLDLGVGGLALTQELVRDPLVSMMHRSELVAGILLRNLDLGQSGLVLAQELIRDPKFSATEQARLAANMIFRWLDLGDGGLLLIQRLIRNPQVEAADLAILLACMRLHNLDLGE